MMQGQETRLRKKGKRSSCFPGVKDYRKVLNFKVDNGWIDKTFVCTACRINCEPLCIGFCPGGLRPCIYQSFGAFRTECCRGEI